jgi:predicted TIM-barrel fold metal-dependent hydrolase
MLIDSNAYIGHWPFRQIKHNSCKTRLELMDQYGIDLSVISNLNGIFYKNTHAANQELHDEIGSSSSFMNRFVPFAVINPIYSGWKDDLEDSVRNMGMKGVRLYPKYHGYALDHPKCIELVQRVRDMDLPVSLSLRMVDSRPSSWLDIKEEWALKDLIPILKKVPDAKYLILNVANSTLLGTEETALLQKVNFVMDTSGRNIIDLGELLKIYGTDKFVFGTHSPILDHRTGLLRIESLRENEANEKTKELLRGRNIQQFLNI